MLASNRCAGIFSCRKFAVWLLLLLLGNGQVIADSEVKADTPQSTPGTTLAAGAIQRPAAPNGVIVTPGVEQFMVSWMPVAGATSYNLHWQETGKSGKGKMNRVEAVASPYLLSGLSHKKKYRVYVTAENTAGESVASIKVESTSTLSQPASPTGISISRGDGFNTLDWQPVKGAESYILRWSLWPWINRKNSYSFEDIQPPFTHSNLDNGVKHYYVVIAVNSKGESHFSYEVSSTPESAQENQQRKEMDARPEVAASRNEGVEGNLPVSPSGFIAIPADGQVFFAWDEPDSSLTYNLYWSAESEITRNNSNKIENIKPGVPHTGLENGKPVYYRLSASNAAGESALSPEVSAIPQVVAPGLVDNIALSLVSPAGENSIELKWKMLPGETRYTVYWNQSGNVGKQDNRIENVTSPYVHSGLKAGETYYYVIEASNSSGESLSHSVRATLLPPAPDIGDVILSKNHEAKLSWQQVKHASGYHLYWGESPGINTSSDSKRNISSPYVLKGLDRGKTYYLAVAANNESGASLSQIRSVTVPPLTPTIGKLTSNNKQADIVINPVDGATAYNIYWNRKGKVSRNDKLIRNVSAEHSHVGLENGYRYFYRISAVNKGGESELSKESSVLLAPDAPVISDIKIDDTRATINWSSVPGADAYRIYWSENEEAGKDSLKQIDTGKKPLKPPFIHTGLVKGKSYYYVVTAVNEAGESAYRKPISAVVAPSTPEILSLTGGDRQVELTWKPVPGATAYNLSWYLVESGKKQVQQIQVDASTLDEAQAKYIHTGRINGAEYVYRIAALNTGGTSKASSEKSIILLPSVPVFTSVVAGDEMATLTWASVSYADSYTIYWGLQEGVGLESDQIKSARSPYTFPGLKNNQSYFFRIVAVNRAGQSGLSAEASATPHKRPLAKLFEDKNLQRCVDRLLKSKGWHYADQITGNLTCNNKNIKSLSGIEDLVNLRSLNLNKNAISDLQYLTELKNLTSLSLSDNKIVDISPLAEMTGLTSLRLHKNRISDITPLSGLKQLTYLSLYRNRIIEVGSLSGLTLLSSLYLNNNKIADVGPLASLDNLKYLDLSRNIIAGQGSGRLEALVSLRHMTKLLLGDNTNVSCKELSTLIATLGSPPVDTDGNDSNFDTAEPGTNCTEP